MKNLNRLRICYLSACMMAGALGYGSPAIATKPVPNNEFDVTFAQGLACDNFALRIVGSGGQQVLKTFVDENGNPVRSLSAGTGSNLSYEALDENGSILGTFSTKSNGSVTQITYNTNGSQTYRLMGHNILILFPSDVPAGPSTTLYVGQVVFTVDTEGVFTLQQGNGNTTDICAVLFQ